jgi:NAD(P)-dependent dehydrogenase (short-subunit alcohol dehydrogenase family)
MRFKDRIALITGGASGIGRATLFRLVEEGAQVIVADCDVELGNRAIAEVRERGGTGFFQEVDLADEESIKRLGTSVAEQVPRLNVLVNSAGIGRGASIEQTGHADWDLQVAVNLRAPALVAQALLPLLKVQGGAIVNLSSDGAFFGRGGCWVYDATKAGIVALTRSMAAELYPYKIRANAVAPAGVVTEFHFGNHPHPEARKKELEDLDAGPTYCIMRRWGRPEEIAAAITFLASDDASYITATTMHVDGGRRVGNADIRY